MLPVVNMEDVEKRPIVWQRKDIMKALKQRIRDGLLIVLTLMTLFAILTIVIGLFLPYAKSHIYVNDEWQWETVHRLIHALKYEVYGNLKFYLLIMGIGLVVSHVALVCFGKFNGIGASTVMLFAAVGGRCILALYKKEVFTLLHRDYLSLEKTWGVSVLEIAYVALIISAVIALAIDIYDIYISKCEMRKDEAI